MHAPTVGLLVAGCSDPLAPYRLTEPIAPRVRPSSMFLTTRPIRNALTAAAIGLGVTTATACSQVQANSGRESPTATIGRSSDAASSSVTPQSRHSARLGSCGKMPQKRSTRALTAEVISAIEADGEVRATVALRPHTSNNAVTYTAGPAFLIIVRDGEIVGRLAMMGAVAGQPFAASKAKPTLLVSTISTRGCPVGSAESSRRPLPSGHTYQLVGEVSTDTGTLVTAPIDFSITGNQ